ncbi:MAG: hypothetical protein A2557_13770 [Candidatus Lambdaproteobacteria bacterium RIFOXYD2_FULL_56_26]|uniref:Uncharacterized protein n=1 Tax=Candidatus Lambdaproteobacteria bacterium RIFOXYD2_FULL_56_26 TaxID=1817773 RepID=A0A1F6H0I8_9PROT|nr:MAG: hypothetical protein A2557_13770 [Candidatus Lambdaproteobacteria bacterium RIFOXYD2_FULL_56_26]
MVRPTNQLKTVRDLLNQGLYRINPDVLQKAKVDFGWEEGEIIKAVKKLNVSQCYNTVPHTLAPTCWVDYYRAKNLHLERDVYLHFYVHAGTVVINSFKKGS